MYDCTALKLELVGAYFGVVPLNNLVCQCTGRQFQWPPVKSRMRRRNTRNDTRQTQLSEYLNLSLNFKLRAVDVGGILPTRGEYKNGYQV